MKFKVVGYNICFCILFLIFENIFKLDCRLIRDKKIEKKIYIYYNTIK